MPGRVITIGDLSLRVSARGVLVCVAFAAALLVTGFVAVTTGTLDLSVADVFGALVGQGEEAAVRTVQERRLPRFVTAALVGGGLGVAGSIFQSLSRNALGSPDIIGFTSGAATGAVLQIVAFGGGVAATAIAAVVGGAVTAAVTYSLARRDGVTGGIRLVLVGIGIGALMSAITQLLVVRAELDSAVSAQVWLAGSLLGRDWVNVIILLACFAILLPALVHAGRRLTLMEMGDDLAGGLGIPVERTRMLAVLGGVLLTGIAVATTGPIAFVALAAPQIAKRLARRDGVLVVASFLLGALLLALADLLAQQVDVGLRMPVGTVTSLLGGVYLVWLLARRA